MVKLVKLMTYDFDSLEILNPKLKPSKKGQQSDSALFSYYAGFSENFTVNLLEQLAAQKSENLTIFDPWNGSGTTTFAAYKLGYNAIGSDLNPVMLIIAKARLISTLDLDNLKLACQNIITRALNTKEDILEGDPLEVWFTPKSASFLRKIEDSINKTFLYEDHYSYLSEKHVINNLSSIGAFIYVILFKTVKTLLKSFIPSNPTWIKKPKSSSEKIEVEQDIIKSLFFNILDETVKHHNFELYTSAKEDTIKLQVDNSNLLHQANQSIDLILTSPPYCTRIDYAVATSIEIAIIRISNIKFLRDSLIGTSTIKKEIITVNENWGITCNNFLDKVKSHSSVSSSTYYYKNHLQYFKDLYKSIEEISRILKVGGVFVPVVQNSYYKEVENNLAQIVIEMCEYYGLALVKHKKFPAKTTMSSINTKSNKYIIKKDIFESVLIFENHGKD